MMARTHRPSIWMYMAFAGMVCIALICGGCGLIGGDDDANPEPPRIGSGAPMAGKPLTGPTYPTTPFPAKPQR